MNKLQKLEKLMADHAYWSGEIKRLKLEGENAYSSCLRLKKEDSDNLLSLLAKPMQKTCIEIAYSENQAVNSELSIYGDHERFNETFTEMVYCGEICEHCQLTRDLKSERMNARRRLGQVRSAITRVGQGINRAKSYP